MSRALETRAPPSLGRVLSCVEAVDDYSRPSLADDFAHQMNITKADRDAAIAFIDGVLGHEAISNADLKGFLNRLVGDWGVTSPYGADAKAARRHLEAARDAIENWHGWIS